MIMNKSLLQDQQDATLVDVTGPISEIRKAFVGQPDELIPMLQLVQRSLGYLPKQALMEIAQMTGVAAATVYGVATFYSQFRLQPVGKHVIKVCRGTACHVRGSGKILKDIEARLHVSPGETTSDQLFTLETVACFGSCALAPVMVIDEAVHGRMDSATSTNMVDELIHQAEAKPTEETADPKREDSHDLRIDEE